MVFLRASGVAVESLQFDPAPIHPYGSDRSAGLAGLVASRGGATQRFLTMRLSPAERDKLAYRNAERVFRIAPQ